MPVGDVRQGATEIDQVPRPVLLEIRHFFEVYKALEPGKSSSTAGLAGRDAAWDELRKARANYPGHH